MNFLEYTILGLGSAAIYAAAAFGIVVIHRGTGTLNFAQGATALMAAEIFVSVYARLSLAIAVIISLLFGVAINLAIAFLLMKPLAKAAPVTRLIATLGLFALLQQVTVAIFGSNPRATKSFLPVGTWHITSSLFVEEQQAILMLIVIVVCVILTIVFAKSKFGALTDASAENPLGVAALGHSPDIMSGLSWAIGGLLAAATGIVVVPITGVTPLPLALVILPAFAAAILGGMRSFPMVLLGAVVVGCGQSLTSEFVSSTWSDALPFLVIAVVVTARSSVIPGRAEIIEKLPNVAGGPLPLRRMLVSFALLIVVAFVVRGNLGIAVVTTLLAGLVVLSVVVITGFAGQVSLAQYTLVGIGALVTARTATAWGLPFPVALVVGVAATGLAGLVVGLPALRSRGVALAIVTLGMGIAASDVMFNDPAVVGQIFGTPTGNPSLFGWNITFANHPQRYQLVLAIVFCLVAGTVMTIRRSKFGRRLLAIRSDERAATALGISVVRQKAAAFACAAAIAGVSGAMLVPQIVEIDYTSLSYEQSLNVLLVAIIGGVGWASGALAGGTFVVGALLGFIVTQVTGIADTSNGLIIASSIALLITLVVNPDGVVPGTLKTWLRIRPSKLGTQKMGAASSLFSVDKTEEQHQHESFSFEVQSLSVNYASVRALNQVTFSVAPGEILGIIGPNGAGKTTLLDAISGFAAAHGSVRLGSNELNGLRPNRRARSGIARTFQGVDLFEDLTVVENIAVGSESGKAGQKIRSLPGKKPQLSRLVAQLAADIGVDPYMSLHPSELSGGARRFTGLLRAVAQGQPVLMLDEPAASLDQVERQELARLLQRLARVEGLAILLVEHDVDLVIQVSDRVLAIDFGKEIFYGPPECVRSSAAIRLAYLGLIDEDGVEVNALAAERSSSEGS